MVQRSEDGKPPLLSTQWATAAFNLNFLHHINRESQGLLA